ncbi:reverse transcriptase domain-containing protein [Tanacetum coccineum]
MFRYGETQSEAVKLLIFPFALCNKAKIWFNELNEESITSWEQMRKAFINRFFPPSLFNRLLLEIINFSQLVCENKPTQAILDGTAGGIFLYETPNQAFQYLEDKAMNSQIISLNEELQDIHNKCNELGNASKNHLNDDTPMCERHEANYIQFEGNKDQNSHDPHSHQSHHDNNDSKKSLTELNNGVRNDFKRCICSMRTVHDKLFDKDDQSKTDLEKSMTKFLDDQRNKPDRTDPPPPPQAQTEQVNVVFTGSGKSDDS